MLNVTGEHVDMHSVSVASSVLNEDFEISGRRLTSVRCCPQLALVCDCDWKRRCGVNTKQNWFSSTSTQGINQSTTNTPELSLIA